MYLGIAYLQHISESNAPPQWSTKILSTLNATPYISDTPLFGEEFCGYSSSEDDDSDEESNIEDEIETQK